MLTMQTSCACTTHRDEPLMQYTSTLRSWARAASAMCIMADAVATHDGGRRLQVSTWGAAPCAHYLLPAAAVLHCYPLLLLLPPT